MELKILTRHQFGAKELNICEQSISKLLSSFGFPNLEMEILKQDLLQRHSEKHRHYHDLSHIYNLLNVKKQFVAYLVNPPLVETAIWFHDAIYKPTKNNNEIKSAELALNSLKNKKLPFDINDLKLLIESTAKHQPLKEQSDFLYFLDFDLSILAAEPSVYQSYVAAIRKEYAIYPDLLYKPGRKKVLKRFLDRDCIYFTPLFLEHFEVKARENMEGEL